jgi:hypothetical protein
MLLAAAQTAASEGRRRYAGVALVLSKGAALLRRGRSRQGCFGPPPLPGQDWWVLSEGADELEPEPDESEPELDPDESKPDEPLESVDPLDPSESVEPDEPLEPLEVAGDALCVALAYLAVRPGSWPLARTPKISAHRHRNSATATATIVRRMLRVRARRAARRGWGTAADMAGRLRPNLKASLSAV